MYRGAYLRLLCPTFLERKASPLNKPVHLRIGTDELRYQVKVLATGVSAGNIETIMSDSVDCSVVSVSRAPNATLIFKTAIIIWLLLICVNAWSSLS